MVAEVGIKMVLLVLDTIMFYYYYTILNVKVREDGWYVC